MPSRRLYPVQPLPATLREKLELCATEARHRGQYGPMVQALRQLQELDEQERKAAEPKQQFVEEKLRLEVAKLRYEREQLEKRGRRTLAEVVDEETEQMRESESESEDK